MARDHKPDLKSMEAVYADIGQAIQRTLSEMLREDPDPVSLGSALRTEPALVYLTAYVGSYCEPSGLPKNEEMAVHLGAFTIMYGDAVGKDLLFEAMGLMKPLLEADKRGERGIQEKLFFDGGVDARRHLADRNFPVPMSGLANYVGAIRSAARRIQR